MLFNPYTPGAGIPPNFLAGRDDKIDDAKNAMLHLINGYTKQYIIYYGLRGVGKTVLLNKIEEIAEEYEILNNHIEVKETKEFKKDFATSIIKQIHTLSKLELFKTKFKKSLGALKAFVLKWSPDGDVSFGIDIEALAYIAGTGDYENDFTETLIALGELLKANEKTLCFFIDELQYLKKDEIDALSMGLHIINQRKLPIYFIGAGLPKVVRAFADAKSYTERLFNFVEIGKLDREYTSSALCEPASDQGVIYNDDAILKIFEETKGYPFFIQLYGECVWGHMTSENVIDLNSANDSYPIFIDRLDESFFKSRFDKATPGERNFMFSMVKCNSLPCLINDVIEYMDKPPGSISTFRRNLIKKGLIYQTDHGRLDFSVPLFDEYLKRINPTLGWID